MCAWLLTCVLWCWCILKHEARSKASKARRKQEARSKASKARRKQEARSKASKARSRKQSKQSKQSKMTCRTNSTSKAMSKTHTLGARDVQNTYLGSQGGT